MQNIIKIINYLNLIFELIFFNNCAVKKRPLALLKTAEASRVSLFSFFTVTFFYFISNLLGIKPGINILIALHYAQ